MFKPISISLSPNTERDDTWQAFRLLFLPWKWKKGNALENLEKEFAGKLGVQHVYAFNSGRSAFLAILDALNLEKGSEVLLQAFTCNAVPNPVLWLGLKPIYVDCNKDDFNIDVEDVERKITPKSKMVLVQHTFGMPADMGRIIEICKKHNLILIEDCAHALGATYKGQEVGTFGRVAFFSFSRDKIISSVYGGMAVTNDYEIAQRIRRLQNEVGYPSRSWVVQQLWHPVYMNWKVLPLYGFVGKYLLVLAQKIGILSKAVHAKEKRGVQPAYFPKRMPNALAILAVRQLGKLDRFNAHRKRVAEEYYEELQEGGFVLPKQFTERQSAWLRFTVRHERAHEITKKAWKKNILLGDWYTTVLAPADTQLEKFGYTKGSCPTAEKFAQTTLNLPTHIRMQEKDIKTVIDFIKAYAR